MCCIPVHMMDVADFIAARVGTLGIQYRCSLENELLIDPLTECWMVDDALLSDSDSVVLVVYLVLRLKTPRMSCISAPLFDTRLVGFVVLDLVQLVIGSCSRPYEGY